MQGGYGEGQAKPPVDRRQDGRVKDKVTVIGPIEPNRTLLDWSCELRGIIGDG